MVAVGQSRGTPREHSSGADPHPATPPRAPHTYQPPDVHHHDEELVVLVGDGELHLPADLPQGPSPRGVCRGGEEGARVGREPPAIAPRAASQLPALPPAPLPAGFGVGLVPAAFSSRGRGWKKV